MRVGNNPNKDSPAPASLQRIVLHVITNLPNLNGYHKDRLRVIKTCLTTMMRGVHYPHSLVISDNGSISELLEWIQDEIKPTMLIQSQNLGKMAERKLVASMLPPDSILCYSDDDMFFYDNWLTPQLALLNYFPNVACVSGYPVRTSFRWGNTNTKKWAEKRAVLEKGRFLPDEWEKDFSISIGRDPQVHKQGTKSDLDYRIEYKGKQAYATSHHCQQIGYAGIISRALQFDGMALGEERSLDERLDKIGLRLSTTDRLVRHMGNVIDSSLETAIADWCASPMEA